MRSHIFQRGAASVKRLAASAYDITYDIHIGFSGVLFWPSKNPYIATFFRRFDAPEFPDYVNFYFWGCQLLFLEMSTFIPGEVIINVVYCYLKYTSIPLYDFPL